MVWIEPKKTIYVNDVLMIFGKCFVKLPTIADTIIVRIRNWVRREVKSVCWHTKHKAGPYFVSHSLRQLPIWKCGRLMIPRVIVIETRGNVIYVCATLHRAALPLGLIKIVVSINEYGSTLCCIMKRCGSDPLNENEDRSRMIYETIWIFLPSWDAFLHRMRTVFTHSS